jgi:hypothetical protein
LTSVEGSFTFAGCTASGFGGSGLASYRFYEGIRAAAGTIGFLSGEGYFTGA